MIDWYRLGEGNLKQMGLLATERGLAIIIAHTEAPLSGLVKELKMMGSEIGEIFDHLQLENSSGHECSSIGKLCSLR